MTEQLSHPVSEHTSDDTKGSDVKHIIKIKPAAKPTPDAEKDTKNSDVPRPPRPGGGCIPIGD